jgi:hypothetical protein
MRIKLRQLFSAVLLAGVFTTTPGSGQTPPVLGIPMKPSQDAPVAIQWQSDPAGLYTIQYSVGLTNDWNTVATGFPTQGTNTVWSDFGNEDAAQYSVSSADPSAPYRFYRVGVESLMDTSLPISVNITNLPSGSSLGGLITVGGTASASQGLASVGLYVEGYLVNRTAMGSFALTCDTRFFANGPHVLAIEAEDIGGLETTDETNSVSARGPSFGYQTVNVTFTNFISCARLRFDGFRPDLGQTQEVVAVWATPRNWRVDITPASDPTTVYQSYSGSGSRVVVDWNGTVSGVELSPQMLAFQLYDLGAGQAQGVGGGGGGGPPSPQAATVSLSGAANLGSENTNTLPPFPLDPSTWGKRSPQDGIMPPRSTFTSFVAGTTSRSTVGSRFLAATAPGSPSMTLPFFNLYMGTVALLGQGHHPLLGNYFPPQRIIGGAVRMNSARTYGPWGHIKSVAPLLSESARIFPKRGYAGTAKHLHDQVLPGDLMADTPSNVNVVNRANLAIYIGHSAAALDEQAGYFYPQAYIPIYNSIFDQMTWVGTAQMSCGSSQLKWMAFYTCNIFRDSLYRSQGIYVAMKQSFALPLNTSLHIMQAYATEVSIHPEFAFWWTQGLQGSIFLPPSPNFHTVIGAWNYACLQTQPVQTPSDPANVARSAAWPECLSDYLYGYGSQTDPNRDPTDPTQQADIVEVDQLATGPVQ